jgi:signal transduction histidine kinase
MARKGDSVLQTRFFYVGSIFAVSFGLVSLMWRFRAVNWILIGFGLAWVVVVTAFAYEVVTRAERLDAIVKARTDALEDSNRHLSALLAQLSAFHTVSYEINQRLELREVARTFADRLCRTLSGVDGAWLWLAAGLADGQDGGRRWQLEAPETLRLAAQAGRDFGMPDELDPLRPHNPLVSRCFDGRSVALEHNLEKKAMAWNWPWLGSCGMESFAGFPLQLGGAMFGMLGVFSRSHISAEFVSQLHLSVNQLTVALEKARLLEETRLRAEELAAVNRELRQLDAMKDWFVSSVSHELRTPLTNIRSFGEILESYEDLTPDERKEFASVIRQESERLSELINDVLDLAKMADGEVDLHPAHFALGPLVARCCKPFSQEAEDREIAFRYELPDELPPTCADEKGVGRVLTNLVANAFKFTPDGGRIEVTAELVRPGARAPERVNVLVSDTGVGIPLAEQPRVFEKFTQISNGLGGKPRGTGIGLAICREIVEKSGGEIWVQSRPREGSTFGFSLPLEQPAAAKP